MWRAQVILALSRVQGLLWFSLAALSNTCFIPWWQAQRFKHSIEKLFHDDYEIAAQQVGYPHLSIQPVPVRKNDARGILLCQSLSRPSMFVGCLLAYGLHSLGLLPDWYYRMICVELSTYGRHQEPHGIERGGITQNRHK